MIHKSLVTAAVVIGLITLSSCHHIHYTTGKPASTKVVEGTDSFFLGGLIGISEIKVFKACPNGASKIHVYETFLDGLCGFLTLSIWQPRTYEITCAAEE